MGAANHRPSANADSQTKNTANSIDVGRHGIGGIFTLPDRDQRSQSGVGGESKLGEKL